MAGIQGFPGEATGGGGGGTTTVQLTGLVGSLIGHQTLTASGVWSKPANTGWVRVFATGGGGGGGGRHNNAFGHGGAGGGGSTVESVVDVTNINTVAFTVGAGGTAGNGGTIQNPGSAGGTSNFGSYAQAAGGVGGVGTPQTAPPHIAGLDGVGVTGDYYHRVANGEGIYGPTPNYGTGGLGAIPAGAGTVGVAGVVIVEEMKVVSA